MFCDIGSFFPEDVSYWVFDVMSDVALVCPLHELLVSDCLVFYFEDVS